MGRKAKKRSGGHGSKGKGPSGAPREKKKSVDQLEGPMTSKSKGGPTSPVPGLSNLGNTCFFNAVMQCIGQSHYFRERLELHVQSPTFSCELMLPGTHSASGDKPAGRRIIVQEKPGELTTKLSTFLGQMREGGGRTLNPKPVFSEICRKAPRFSGYHQQDSQELLRYLLDSLRSEEVYRIKKALLLSYNVQSGKSTVTEDDRKEIRQYGIQAQLARTFVDDVFAGRLVSTVVCRECGNCSTIHETFLDLSLPIADDTGVQGQQSGGRDQRKNKGGRRTAVSNHEKGGGDKVLEKENVLNSPLLPTDKISKHQQQKARKQREKAAKKEAKFKAKKQQSLQEFLSASKDMQKEQTSVELTANAEADAENENGTVTQSLKLEGETKENINTASDCQKSDQADSVDISSTPGDDHDVDPATGECKSVIMDTKEPVQGQADPNDTNTQDSTFLDYASAGPQPDQTDVAEKLEGITLDGDDSPKSFGVEEGQVEESTEDSELVNLPNKADTILSAALEELKVPTDSLEGSLKRFCTPELLTGSNKFACAVCTEESGDRSASMKEEVTEKEGNGEDGRRLEREEGEQGRPMEMEVNDRDLSSQPTHCESEKKMTVQPIKVEESAKTEESIDFTQTDEPGRTIQVKDSTLTESATALVDSSLESTLPNRESKVGGDVAVPSITSVEQVHNIAGNEEGLNGDVSLLSPNSVEREPDRNETDDKLPLLEDDESEDEERKTLEQEQSKSSLTVVFSEATKQFLIESLPLVLTLNLKRFIQHGRRLQKNSRHISFPTILNMAPFCTDNCKVCSCDSKGQLLYSLYGVVEHSGGMQGGHYTAYVRTRTPLKLDLSKIMSKPESDGGHRLSDKSAADIGASEGSEAAAAALSDFDLSSSGGQWYFISDSHVRTATESEVLKSPAYLLFYERLPLSSS